MWDLVVYQLQAWNAAIEVVKFGRYYDLGDCLTMYKFVVEEIAKSDLIGTYIPMCARVL